MLIRIKDGPMFLEDYVFITPVQSETEVPGLIDEKKPHKFSLCNLKY